MARWDEFFAQGLDTGTKLAFEKWKDEQDQVTNNLALAKLQQDMLNRTEDMAFKEKQETRRTSESDARKQFYNQRNKVFDTFFGGAGGVGGIGGNLPAGTTISLGGLTIPLNRKYTEGESKSLSGADALLSDIGELKKMYSGKSIGGLGQLLGGASMMRTGIPMIDEGISNAAMGIAGLGKGSSNRQNYIDLVKNIANRLLYLRSGAQINESEYQRFKAQLPSFFRNDKLDIKQLDRFAKEFSSLSGRIQSGATWDNKNKSFIGGENKTNSINLDELFKDLETPSEEE